MGMSKCYSLMKCLLIIFNIIFLIVGVSVCALCAWALWDGRAAGGAGGVGSGAAGRAGLCALCAWGGALVAAALHGLAGACRHSASLLAAAFALLALCGVAEGAAAWWGAAHAGELRAALRAELARAVREEYGVVASRTAALDAIQRHLQCCGEGGARDWHASAWARAQAASAPAPADTLDLSVRAPPQHYAVPASCCARGVGGAACEAARRVPAASAGGAGLHAAPCGPRVLAALAAAARPPLALAASLLAAHAIALLLTLALCLRAHPTHHYKA